MLKQALRGRVLSRIARGREWSLEGAVGVAAVGHRAYIGGRWEELGRVQFDYMVSRGLKPDHVFLDIACGALRGGVHFIAYLDPGNYLGIEKEKVLIRRGLAKELPRKVRREKRPEFVVSGDFEFDRFSKPPDFSLAQSLFTHLIPVDLDRCLAKLRARVGPQHEFYATFAIGESELNAPRSHAHDVFRYSPDELIAAGQRNGWASEYLGDWGHGRSHMMKFLPQ